MAYPVMSPTMPWSLVKSGFKKTPHFNTVKQIPAARRGRSAYSLTPYATWDFEVDLNKVKGGEGITGSVLQDFLGTYMECRGGADFFYFTDPNDNTVGAVSYDFILENGDRLGLEDGTGELDLEAATGQASAGLAMMVTPGSSPMMGLLADGVCKDFQLGRNIKNAIDVLEHVTITELLVNGAYQNLLLYSQRFDYPAWTKRGSLAVNPDTVVAPDGSSTADALTGIAGASAGDIYQACSAITPGQAFSPSIHIKRVSTSGTLLLRNPGGNTYGEWSIDLSKLSSGWERITRNHPAVTENYAFVGGPAGECGLWLLKGTGTGTLSANVWGAQVETGDTTRGYQWTTVAPVTWSYTESKGVVTFPQAPPVGAFITWSGTFRYLCQFTEDTLASLARVDKSSEGFLWSCDSITFESV